MTDDDAEFREFAAAFGEPLARVAYLLVAGVDPSGVADRDEERARERMVRALARTRRYWREALSDRSPESVAVESLVTRLPRALARPSRPPAGPDLADPDKADDADDADDTDVELLLDAAWRAWKALLPAERVPLLFAEVGVASSQLQDITVPEAFGSYRRLRSLENSAWVKLRASIAADPAAAMLLERRPPGYLDESIDTLVARMLAREAVTVTTPVDAYPQALAVASRTRRRIGVAVTAVAACVAVISVVGISTSRNTTSATVADSTSSSPSVAPSSGFVASGDERVVDWPIRGGLHGDTTLLSNLRTAFVANHPDAIGDVQILLAADTSSFRVAFVAAHSRQGVIRSWFFGPLGSQSLTEGSFSYSGNILHGSVIAAALSDPAGHSALVVIGPPETTSVLLSDVGADNFYDQSFATISQDGGIVVRDVSQQYLPSLFVKLFEDQQLGWNRPVPVIQLGKREPDLPPVTIVRGTPDAAVLARALDTEADWARTGELNAGGQAVVLWGGSDDRGEQLVVLRVKTLHLADLLIVAWPDGDGEYLLRPDAPDYPIGFAYPTGKAARVGVLTAPGVASATLVEDGVVTNSAPVDATGFASLEVNRPYPALAQRSFVVRLYDAAGRQVSELPVPPEV
jgi:hypothetical protein